MAKQKRGSKRKDWKDAAERKRKPWGDMNCTKCNCVLEQDEENDIVQMQSMGLNPPKICTECLDDLIDSGVEDESN